MADVIVQEKSVIVRSNGIQVVEPNPSGLGLDAMSKVTVTANVEDTHILRRLNVTENGEYVAAGDTVYNKVTVNVEPVTEDIDIVSNGTYTPAEGVDGYKKIVVDVPSDVNNQDKTVTENGVITADLGFSGLGQVTVNVEPTEEQIAEFKAEGAEEQKAKLVTLDVTENGVYTKEDGYSRVTVNVQPTEEQKDEYREEGKADQLTADKAAVASASPITANGTKSILDTEVIVNVPSDPEELQAKYDEGEAAGKAEQLSADKIAVAAISPIVENGTKTVLDTVITINVPDSEEGLAAAKAEGKAEQLTTDKAAVVAVSPITENGTKTILGENVVVNVPSDPEELEEKYAEGEAAGKAEQAVADKSAVEAISPITSNGTKTVQLGSETARVVVDVEGGSSFVVPDGTTLSATDKWDGKHYNFDFSEYVQPNYVVYGYTNGPNTRLILTDLGNMGKPANGYTVGDLIFPNGLIPTTSSTTTPFTIAKTTKCRSFGDIKAKILKGAPVEIKIANAETIGDIELDAAEADIELSYCGHIGGLVDTNESWTKDSSRR